MQAVMDQWPFILLDDGSIQPVDRSCFEGFRRGVCTLGDSMTDGQATARVAEVLVEQSRTACLVRRVTYHRYELTTSGTWSAHHRERVLRDQCEIAAGTEPDGDTKVVSLLPRVARARLREHAVWRPSIEDVRALAQAIHARAGRRIRSAPLVGVPCGAKPDPTF